MTGKAAAPVPKVGTADDLTLAVARLKAEGKTPAEIARLQHVSKRTVYRRLEDAETLGLLDLHEPWSLLTAMKRGESPDKARYILTSEWAVGTQQEADWAWMLRSIASGLDWDRSLEPALIGAFTHLYVDTANTVGHAWKARVLDAALVDQPWEGREAMLRFFVHAQSVLPGPELGIWIAEVVEIGRTLWTVPDSHDESDPNLDEALAHLSSHRAQEVKFLYHLFLDEIAREENEDPSRLVVRRMKRKGAAYAGNDHGAPRAEGNAVSATSRLRKSRRQAKAKRTLVRGDETASEGRS